MSTATIKRGLAIAASAAALSVTGVLLGGGTAYAANVYDGTDAQVTGCAADATTVRETNLYSSGNVLVGKIQLRYSNKCHTGWGRILDYVNDHGTLHVQRDQDDHRVESCFSNTLLNWNSSLNAYSCYTPMLYDKGYTMRAYGTVSDNSGGMAAGGTEPY
ncbi:DUF2690 domain-containing protein [Streptomyces sp. NPDC052396]|uniref:DUF2690 domain-containing protein n=1 Tax=Streptomyces sp. NPDC052396 TaxID=3365689 RepID=UPI0037D5486C